MALASLAASASVGARAEDFRERHENRAPERARQAARREAEARPTRHTHPARAEAVHPAANYPRETAARGLQAQRPPSASVVRDSRFAGSGRIGAVSRGPAASQVRVVRYGHTLSGTVERTIRPGLVSRTFVGGGHVLYTRVYQSHVWHQFGRAFAYEAFVPAVRYPAAYYGWALAPWPRPISYAWGWQVQPWYPMYGVLFTPYPVYTSPDLWMTDYIIAQNMQLAYQAHSAPPPPLEAPAAPPLADPSAAATAVQPSDAYSVPQPPEAPPPPPSGDTSSAPPAPQSSSAPPAPPAPPPAITPQVKAQLNTQIKVQLQEQQAAAATPATLTTQTGPAALRPNHVFFEVVQPLDVPTAHGHCSLSANDYIKRTGAMSSDDWMIPVVVELSRPSDCPEGLSTRIGLNDLNAMENEQEAQVMEAMRAASKSMGPNGPPSGVHPTLIADGSAPADPGALDALRQAQ